jgi:uncharacterized membrane protein YgcG
MKDLMLALCTVIGLATTACTAEVSGSRSQAENGLPQSCQANAPDPNACDPADTSKTTVCHIPPGNPANAHTICIGNAAVAKHLEKHGDFVGTCSCTGSGSDGGSGGSGGGGGGGGTGSGGGSGDGTGGGGGIL